MPPELRALIQRGEMKKLAPAVATMPLQMRTAGSHSKGMQIFMQRPRISGRTLTWSVVLVVRRAIKISTFFGLEKVVPSKRAIERPIHAAFSSSETRRRCGRQGARARIGDLFDQGKFTIW
jgi:hypothetical protein